MPHAFLIDTTQGPVATPEPGTGLRPDGRPISETTPAHPWNDDGTDVNLNGATAGGTWLAIPNSGGPGVKPPGVPREARHPAGPNLSDHDGQGRILPSPGLHGELVAGAVTPDGDMLPNTFAAKTWRATPEPWDTGIYAGYTPQPNYDLGDPL